MALSHFKTKLEKAPEAYGKWVDLETILKNAHILAPALYSLFEEASGFMKKQGFPPEVIIQKLEEELEDAVYSIAFLESLTLALCRKLWTQEKRIPAVLSIIRTGQGL